MKNREIKKLKLENFKNQKKVERLGNIFTDGQIRKMECPKKRLRWSQDDISNAIGIYSAGPRAYRLLLKRWYSFPAVVTLRKWCSKIQIA